MALVGVGVLGLARASTATDEEEDPDVGRRLFVRYCSSCHGLDAKGEGPAAAALNRPPPDLTRIALRREGRFPAAELVRIIDGRFVIKAHGSREMPVWGTILGRGGPTSEISDEVARGKIGVLVDYLQRIQVDDSAAPGDS